MKAFLIVILSLSFNIIALGQTFNWTDTSFIKGSKRTIRPYWSMDNLIRLNDDSNTRAIMDTLIQFLIKNPLVKIEIDCHLGQSPAFKLENLSQYRAENIKDYLHNIAGIDTTRIITKGYEFTKPIISQDTINSDKKNEREKVWIYQCINERADIIIN